MRGAREVNGAIQEGTNRFELVRGTSDSQWSRTPFVSAGGYLAPAQYSFPIVSCLVQPVRTFVAKPQTNAPQQQNYAIKVRKNHYPVLPSYYYVSRFRPPARRKVFLVY